MKSNKVVKNVVLLMSLTLLSKFVGFFREQVMSYYYGASMYSDIYFSAYDIPKILFSLLAASLATTYIPMYNRVVEEKGEERANVFTNNVLNLTLLVGFLISVVAFIFMEPIVKVFAYGFKGETFNETVKFTRIMLAGYIFSGMSSVVSSFLQNKDDFLISGITGIPYNVIAILSIVISIYTNNIYILPIGASLALFSQYIIQLPKSFKLGYKPMPVIDFKDKYVLDMLFLVAPVLVSTSVSQINRAVDKTLASTLVVGSMSSLNYSNKLMGFFIGIFITAISIVIFPQLSKMSFDKDKTGFNNLIKRSVNIVYIMIIPITFLCIVLAKPIIMALFMRGAFDMRAANLTTNAFIFYLVGMIGLAMRTVVMKVFYSIGDTKTPMVNSTISVLLNIGLSIALVKPMQNGGLALATSLSYIISMIMLMNSLKKTIGDYGEKEVMSCIAKVFVGSIIMALIAKLVYDFIVGMAGSGGLVNFVGLIIAAAISTLVYLLVVKLLKVDEIDYLFKESKNGIKKLKNKLAKN